MNKQLKRKAFVSFIPLITLCLFFALEFFSFSHTFLWTVIDRAVVIFLPIVSIWTSIYIKTAKRNTIGFHILSVALAYGVIALVIACLLKWNIVYGNSLYEFCARIYPIGISICIIFTIINIFTLKISASHVSALKKENEGRPVWPYDTCKKDEEVVDEWGEPVKPKQSRNIEDLWMQTDFVPQNYEEEKQAEELRQEYEDTYYDDIQHNSGDDWL